MEQPIRVAVVDDNHLIRRLLELILEGAGYVPVLAESGEAALELAQVAMPDLWIVDEAMPGMRGADLVRALRRSPDPRVALAPIIGVSARDGAARELLSAGADTFVPKPVEEDAILRAVQAAVRVGLGAPPPGSMQPAW